MKLLKILLAIISTIIIFYFTNLACPQNSNVNDGYFLDQNTFLGNLINHKPGYVCPLGVILGKIMLILCILQIYVLYNDKYKNYKCIHVLLLFIGITVSFMNYRLQQNILSAFILQLLIILLPN